MTSPVIQAATDSGLFQRLPVTFSVFLQDQLKSWDLLFPAERGYFERLVGLLLRSDASVVEQLFQPMREVEKRMALPPSLISRREFTLDHVDFLNRSPLYPEWRRTVSDLFAKLDPVLDEEVARSGKARLVIVFAPAEIPLAPDRMWTRIAQHGRRVPVTPPEDLADYARLAMSVAARYAGRNKAYETWVVEAGGDWTALDKATAVYLSYAGLQNYRTQLMTDVRQLVETEQIRGPRQLGMRLREMKHTSGERMFGRDTLLAEFTRAVLLNGNGTLLINNTFVEWACVQAIRRARPSMLMTSFGIRNKMKPFSSLLIYTDQEKANVVPGQMDTLGTSVDLEIFYQYLWQECEKYAEYRRNTACLFIAPGADQLLCIAPADFPLFAEKGPVPFSRVMEHAGTWLQL
jgi:hypothetical protein